MPPRKKKPAQRRFGNIRELPSGRFAARYRPPGTAKRVPWVNAPSTFDTWSGADAWLTVKRAELIQGSISKQRSNETLRQYVERWIHQRPQPLKETTRTHYIDMLNRLILPTLGEVPLSA